MYQSSVGRSSWHRSCYSRQSPREHHSWASVCSLSRCWCFEPLHHPHSALKHIPWSIHHWKHHLKYWRLWSGSSIQDFSKNFRWIRLFLPKYLSFPCRFVLPLEVPMFHRLASPNSYYQWRHHPSPCECNRSSRWLDSCHSYHSRPYPAPTKEHCRRTPKGKRHLPHWYSCCWSHKQWFAFRCENYW